MLIQYPVILLRKEKLLSLLRLSLTTHTVKQRRTQTLGCHHAQFKNAPHQSVLNMWIQQCFHSYVQKIHYFLFVCSFLSEIIRQFQKIIPIVDSRLLTGQFYKMMSDRSLIQIITGTSFIKSKRTKHKRICSCQKLAVRTTGPFCKC